MKIQFLGMKSQTKSSGCSVCGKRRVSNDSFTYAKRMVLPSGKIKLFNVGVTYEVTENEAKFLLEYGYNENGIIKYPFIEA